MKYVKMLGLAAIAAMALMSFVASSASATVLYNANGDLGAGTKIESTLQQGTSALLKAGFANITCTQSTVSGNTANTGSATETVHGEISVLEFPNSSCNATVTTLAKGELEIHWISGTENGTLTGRGSEVTVATGGVSCVYGTSTGTDLGTLTGSATTGATAVMDINASLKKISGGLLCANPATWTATYVVTSPDVLNVREK